MPRRTHHLLQVTGPTTYSGKKERTLSRMTSGKKCRHLNRDGVDIGKAEFEVLGFSTKPTCLFLRHNLQRFTIVHPSNLSLAFFHHTWLAVRFGFTLKLVKPRDCSRRFFGSGTCLFGRACTEETAPQSPVQHRIAHTIATFTRPSPVFATQPAMVRQSLRCYYSP